MTILFDTTVFANPASEFGAGILPESPADRHRREQLEAGEAVFAGRATRLPLDSPRSSRR